MQVVLWEAPQSHLSCTHLTSDIIAKVIVSVLTLMFLVIFNIYGHVDFREPVFWGERKEKKQPVGHSY